MSGTPRDEHSHDEQGSAGQAMAVTPFEQAVIRLYDSPIRAVRLPDGRIAAVMTDLCSALGLNRSGQVQRIRADDLLREQMLFCLVDSGDGQQQPMDVLTAWAIPTWLHGIQLSRLAPEKRPAILAFKREAADVLYRHFSQRQTPEQIGMAVPLVPAEPVSQPERPAPNAGRAAWTEYHRAMVAWLEWQDDIDRWRASVNQRQDALEDRMESVEEVTRLIPEILDRLGPETLTPEHQATVKRMVGRLHELTAISYGAIYAELNEAFHVGRYADIADAAWERVTDWFQVRIAAAERRQKR